MKKMIFWASAFGFAVAIFGLLIYKKKIRIIPFEKMSDEELLKCIAY